MRALVHTPIHSLRARVTNSWLNSGSWACVANVLNHSNLSSHQRSQPEGAGPGISKSHVILTSAKKQSATARRDTSKKATWQGALEARACEAREALGVHSWQPSGPALPDSTGSPRLLMAQTKMIAGRTCGLWGQGTLGSNARFPGISHVTLVMGNLGRHSSFSDRIRSPVTLSLLRPCELMEWHG